MVKNAKELLNHISVNCELCHGKCWDENSAVRQSKALKMFGVIPNECADSEMHGPKCPYRQ